MIVCPGCGLKQPEQAGLSEDRHNASAECWRLFGELSGYTLARGRDFIHQHAVDAYGAQHPVETATNIGTAFSLLGLYLAIEKGYTGREVQRAHMQLAARKVWPKLDPPETRGAITVLDVLHAEAGDVRDEAIMRWARSVWDAWASAHEWSREMLRDFRLR